MTRLQPIIKLQAIALGLSVIFALLRPAVAGESVPAPLPPDASTSPVAGKTVAPVAPITIDPLKSPAQKPDDKNAATAKPSAADILSGLDWSASKQSFLEDRGAVVLSGSAWVRYTGVRLDADNIVFYRETREMYAEGHVRMKAGESEMQASSAYIDVDSDSKFNLLLNYLSLACLI